MWSAPDDATRRGPQMLTWYEAYDRLVDELTTHGVQVYGQIGGESVPGGGEPDSDDHVPRYAAAFVQIVDHFRDRVRIFETFNEPNNWRDEKTKRPAVAPLYYAKELQEIYLNTKYDNGASGDPCAQVAIVSGALFSSEDTNAADYWNAGRRRRAATRWRGIGCTRTSAAGPTTASATTSTSGRVGGDDGVDSGGDAGEPRRHLGGGDGARRSGWRASSCGSASSAGRSIK